MRWPRLENRTVNKRVLVLPYALYSWLTACGVVGWVFAWVLVSSKPETHEFPIWAFEWLAMGFIALGFISMGAEPGPKPSEEEDDGP